MVPHCDDETMSLLALGEDPASTAGAGSAAEHLAGCEQCRSELESLRAVVVAAREGGPHLNGSAPVAGPVPPERVWAGIAAATGVTATPRATELHRHAAAVPAYFAPSPAPSPVPSAGPEPAAASLPRARVSAQGRFGPVRRLVAVAAAFLLAGLAAGIGGTWAVLDHRDRSPRTVVLAATSLSGLTLAPDAAGRADVVETSGGRQLDLDVDRLAAPDGFYEVWLIDPTVTKMVAIGVLSGSEGRFTLPAGVDLASYPLVDISIQPLDGDPKHSGRSVLRGTLKS
jgi:hypothetical protein